jgi:heat shock protein HtpX
MRDAPGGHIDVRQKAWLVQRAVLALVLMVSFYALALSVAGVLVWIPYEAHENDVRLPVNITLVCLGLAAAIVWSVLPRIDRFTPPGPAVTQDDEPELFQALQDVADQTGQRLPADVYLVNDVNAFVTERGGVMGVGGRRVMGIGLPLLQSVTVQELRAILAHEFGHYHAGDVTIGPWIYKTRAAIGRTIQQLSDSVLQKIFISYGNLFLRVSHAVSRRQEFIADEVAARAAGASVMASALRKVYGATGAFQGYWNGDVGPILNAGYLPPLTAGFAQFVESDGVKARIATNIRTEEEEGQSNPFDTHPPLRERIAALHTLPDGEPGDTRTAVSLLADPARWERRILGVAAAEWAQSLRTVAWDEVVDEVYAPLWRTTVAQQARAIAGTSIATVPFAGKLAAAVERREFGEAEQAVVRRIHLTAAALSLCLLDAGWNASAMPGDAIVFARDGQEVRPFDELMSVAMGRIAPDAWSARCAVLGLDRLTLGDVTTV